MHVLLLILLPLLFIGIWVFANYQPDTPRRAAVQRYNRILAILTLLSPLGLGLLFWWLSRTGSLTASWPVLTIMAGILLMALMLLFGSALRMMIFDTSKD